jgi:hypothetical protein
MQKQQQTLINELQQKTEQFIETGIQLKSLSNEQLNWKENANSWSILECLEHLNRYGDYYLVEIEQRMLSSTTKAPTTFKSGWLGNYFVQMMLPKKSGKVKKMKTVKDMNPTNSNLSTTIIDRFLKQQKRMIELLEQGKKANLTQIKTGVTFSKLIKIRLGDTFRFLIAHNNRHLDQALRAREATI